MSDPIAYTLEQLLDGEYELVGRQGHQQLLSKYGLRRCTKCEMLRSTEDFYPSPKDPHNTRTATCRICYGGRFPTAALRLGYPGMLDVYRILRDQEFCCAICGIQETARDSVMSLDYDTDSSAWNRLICLRCRYNETTQIGDKHA